MYPGIVLMIGVVLGGFSAPDATERWLDYMRYSGDPIAQAIYQSETEQITPEEAEAAIRKAAAEAPERLKFSKWLNARKISIVKIYAEFHGIEQAVATAREKMEVALSYTGRDRVGDSLLHYLVLTRYGKEEGRSFMSAAMHNPKIPYAVRFAAAFSLARYGSAEQKGDVLSFLKGIPQDERDRRECYIRGAPNAGSGEAAPVRFDLSEGNFFETEDLFQGALCELGTRAAQEVLAKALGTHPDPFFTVSAGQPTRIHTYMAKNAPELFLPFLDGLLDLDKSYRDDDPVTAVHTYLYAFRILLIYYSERLDKNAFKERFARCLYDLDNPLPDNDGYSIQKADWFEKNYGEEVRALAETIKNMK